MSPSLNNNQPNSPDSPNLFSAFPLNFNMDFLKDGDNMLILALLLILMKEKADKSLIIALISIIVSQ